MSSQISEGKRRQQIGAKAVTWSWHEIQDTYSQTDALYRLNEQQAAALLTVASQQMGWLTRWFDSPGAAMVREFAAETAYRLMNPTTPPTPAAPPVTRSCGQTIIIEEDEVPLPFSIQKRGGEFRLVYDCGCGEFIEFALSQVAGPNAGAADPSQNGGGFPPNTPAVRPSVRECYNEKAAAAYMGIMTDYVGAIYDFLATGLTATQLADEAIDAAANLVDAIIGGDNYSSLTGATKGALITALESYESAIAAAWPTDGEISRFQLQALTFEVFPQLDGAIPVLFAADLYANFGNVRKLNARLSLAAAECATGGRGALPEPLPYEVIASSSGDWLFAYYADGLPQQVNPAVWDVNLGDLDRSKIVGARFIRVRGSGPNTGGLGIVDAGDSYSSSNVAADGVFTDSFSWGSGLAALDSSGLLDTVGGNYNLTDNWTAPADMQVKTAGSGVDVEISGFVLILDNT